MSATSKKLAEKFRTYILTETEPVSMDYLIKRAESKGHPTKVVLTALQFLHRYKDIKQSTRDDVVHYARFIGSTTREDNLPVRIDRELHKRHQEEWNRQCEEFEKLPDEWKAKVYDIFKEVGTFEVVGDSYVPTVNVEQHKNRLHADSRRKNSKRRNRLPKKKRTLGIAS